MRKMIGIVLTSLLLFASVQGVTSASASAKTGKPSLMMLLLRAGYFVPSEKDFRKIYGSGPAFGTELRLGRKRLAAWLEGSYFGRSGELSKTAEATKVKIMALEGGALWRIKTGKMTPYIGAGAGYFQYKETNIIGEAKQGKVGFCGIAGATLTLARRLIFDCRLKYSLCNMQPADFKINIGGLTAGVGLGIRF